MERNNLQVELIVLRFRKNIDFIHVYFCEARNAMQYHPPDANIHWLSDCMLSLGTMGVDT